MATAEQVKALLRSYSDGDSEHFLSVAIQIAAHAARTGKSNVAWEIRDLVDGIKHRRRTDQVVGPVPIARPTGELAGMLVAAYPKTRLSEMVLFPQTRRRLERVIREYRSQEILRGHGLSARRKLLLVGPPGCGKTMTASVLAAELRLPLFSVQLHGLITKYMGETSAKLYAVFEAMKQTRSVYVFDEFDAIGGDRGAGNDVGEMRRVLNSFLQFLERDDSDSLIVAATNYVEMLDDALFRRFDDVICYSRPTPEQVSELVRNRLLRLLVGKPDWAGICGAATGLSHSDIAQACSDAAKDCILADKAMVSTSVLVDALLERRRTIDGLMAGGRLSDS